MPDPITDPGPEPEPWAPPKCYVHVAPDGTFDIVDADGKPFPAPPFITKDVNGGVKYLDPWGNEVPQLYPPAGEPPDGFVPPEYYVDVSPDGSYTLVDSDGKPFPSPPAVYRWNGGADTIYRDQWGNEVPTLYPPAGTAPDDWPPLSDDQIGSKYYIVDRGNGIYDLYDSDRVLVPRVGGGAVNYAQLDYEYDEQTDTYRYFTSDGTEIPPLPQQFTPPECFVHVAPDGSYKVVDSDGNLLPSAPFVTKQVNGGVTYEDPWGNEIESFYPPAGEPPEGFDPSFFVHIGADGTLTAVDSTGTPLSCQPEISRIVDGSGDVTYVDPWGNDVSDFHDPLSAVDIDRSDVYIHIAPDGTFQVVDGEGELVPSPPLVTAFYDGGELVFHDSFGNEMDTFYPPPGTAPDTFTPPECYVHIAADGTYQVVDAAGNLLPSPPMVTPNFHLGKWVYHDPWGNEIPTLYPPAGEPPTDWPPPGQDEDPSPDQTSDESDGGAEPDDGAGSGDGAGSAAESEPVVEPGTSEGRAEAEPVVEPGTAEGRAESEPVVEPGTAEGRAESEPVVEPGTSEGRAESEPVVEPGTAEGRAESEPVVESETPPGRAEAEPVVEPGTAEGRAESEPVVEPGTSEGRAEAEPVVGERVVSNEPDTVFDAEVPEPDAALREPVEATTMPLAEDLVAAAAEPGPSVLPTPLSVEDAMAIAEGDEFAAVDRVGAWEPTDELEADVDPAADAAVDFVETLEERPVQPADEIAAPPPEPVLAAPAEFRSAGEDAEAEQPASDVGVPVDVAETAADLADLQAEPIDVAQATPDLADLQDEPIDVAQATPDLADLQDEPIDVAQATPDLADLADLQDERIGVAEEFEMVDIGDEPIYVAEEFEMVDIGDELVDEPVILEMTDIEQDIELLDLDELET